MRIDPVDHSSSNWMVVPNRTVCITTTSDTTITALGVDIRWKSSDLWLYDANSPGMAAQVSTTAAPTKTVTTAAPTKTVTTAAPTNTATTTVTVTVSQAGESDTHKLGTGVKIGIGFGVPTLVLICLIAFLFLRKRRTLGARAGLGNNSASSVRELAHDWADGAYNESMELRVRSEPKSRKSKINSSLLRPRLDK